MSVSELVSCDWLAERLDKGDHSEILVIDVSWFSDKDGRGEYLRYVMVCSDLFTYHSFRCVKH